MKTRDNKPKVPTPVGDSPAKQLAGFIAKFDPATATMIKLCRAALRKRMPTAFELVYDHYNFFVIGFCSTPRASDCIVSLATSANGVGLCFIFGAKLPDPHKILLGSGKQTRFIRLESAATLAQPAVESLIRAAIANARAPLPSAGGGTLIIKSVSAKQRSRRKTATSQMKVVRSRGFAQ
ncbi:MAG: DUF1801 domain-containing protein [Phycisphaerae bacterium]|nr:DUF1801 domain-containing protein [Phycisphaerae bacterium]